jgi:nitroreductase
MYEGDARMPDPAPADYPIHDLIARRWSPRAFDRARDIEPGTLRTILEAARWAPSSFNAQPWAFLVATRDKPEEFAKMLSCLVEKNQSWARDAAALMISVAHTTFAHNGKPNRHAFHDVGHAVANLTHQALALDLYLHQMAGIYPDKVRELYHVPRDWEPVAGIAVGYLGKPDQLPEDFREKDKVRSARKPQREFVFRGDWDSPL